MENTQPQKRGGQKMMYPTTISQLQRALLATRIKSRLLNRKLWDAWVDFMSPKILFLSVHFICPARTLFTRTEASLASLSTVSLWLIVCSSFSNFDYKCRFRQMQPGIAVPRQAKIFFRPSIHVWDFPLKRIVPMIVENTTNKNQIDVLWQLNPKHSDIFSSQQLSAKNDTDDASHLW